MINYTFKRDHRVNEPMDAPNFYQKSFALALLNWEINRQEERLNGVKVVLAKKQN